MPMIWNVIIIVVFVALGAFLTIRIGNSRQNKEGNPQYEQRSGGVITNLSLIYVVASIVSTVILVYVIFQLI